MAAHRQPNGPVHISVLADVLRAPATTNAHIHSDLLVHDFAIADNSAIARPCEKPDTIAMKFRPWATASKVWP